MLKQRTVPGVYIQELNAFPNSVVAVETALPVFIGYTESVDFKGMPLQNKVVRIESMADYTSMYGGGPPTTFEITAFKADDKDPSLTADVTLNKTAYSLKPANLFYMYNSIQLFYQNGGGSCYIMSIGTYTKEGANGPAFTNFDTLSGGGKGDIFSVLKTEQEPTMIVIPDALLFGTKADYYKLMNLCLNHCADVQSRITLIDAYGGDTVTDPLTFAAKVSANADPVSVLRDGIASPFLNYGVAYYPWLNTSVVSAIQITYSDVIAKFKGDYIDTDPKIKDIVGKIQSGIPAVPAATDTDQVKTVYNAALLSAHNALLIASPNYFLLIQGILKKMNCLPAASAVAGQIALSDASQGVWKAPANVSLNAVQSAVLNVNDDLQSNMNVDAVTGKSVNAIRPFKGFGVMIWGARTLDGNSQDWRYVSVRRTLIMIEQSIKLAARSYVFEANDANTWINLKSEIENFLTGIWKQGGLAGSKPEEAFSVSVGLGSTMIAQDILDGYLDVAVLVAVTHPAEFIEISFKQQLQKS